MSAEGRCFELAARHLWKDPSWTLVHGYAQLVKSIPLLMAHAWLEKDGTAFDPTRHSEPVPLRRYRRIVSAKTVRRYSAAEVNKLLLTHKHWGPWGTCRHDLLPITGAHK